MREELEELCVLMADPTTLVAQVYATDPDMQQKCQSFLCREGLDRTACDGFSDQRPI